MKLRRVPRMLRSSAYLGTGRHETPEGTLLTTVTVERVTSATLPWQATVKHSDGIDYTLAFRTLRNARYYFAGWEEAAR